MKMQFLADHLDAKLVQRSQRTVGLALAGAETGEIMSAGKPVRRRLHRARLQRRTVMPDPPMIEGRRLPAGKNAVEIAPSGGGKSGMRLVRHPPRPRIVTGCPAVSAFQRRHHPIGVELLRNIQMRHLAGGMDTQIGASRPWTGQAPPVSSAAASSSTCCTDSPLSWRCQPTKNGPPSYSTVMKIRLVMRPRPRCRRQAGCRSESRAPASPVRRQAGARQE